MPVHVHLAGGHVDEGAEDDPLGVGEGLLVPLVAARAGKPVVDQVLRAGHDEVPVEPLPGPAEPVAVVLPLRDRGARVQAGRDGQEELVLDRVLPTSVLPPQHAPVARARVPALLHVREDGPRHRQVVLFPGLVAGEVMGADPGQCPPPLIVVERVHEAAALVPGEGVLHDAQVAPRAREGHAVDQRVQGIGRIPPAGVARAAGHRPAGDRPQPGSLAVPVLQGGRRGRGVVRQGAALEAGHSSGRPAASHPASPRRPSA